MRPFRKLRDCEGGGATIEFAIISFALILVSLGVIEFGRALHVRNEMSFAADFGARKVLADPALSNADVEAEVRSAFTSADPQLLGISLGSEAVDGTNFRTIGLNYPFKLLIPFRSGEPISLTLTRRVPMI